jgi:hypothetical protein
MEKPRSFPRTSKYSRKVMENETSGSFSSVTGAENDPEVSWRYQCIIPIISVF